MAMSPVRSSSLWPCRSFTRSSSVVLLYSVILLAAITAVWPSHQLPPIEQPLFHFDAALLGPAFRDIIDDFDEWIGRDGPSAGIDEAAAEYASSQAPLDRVRSFREDCYAAPEKDYYDSLEQRKKHVTHQHMSLAEEIHEVHRLFSGNDNSAADMGAHARGGDGGTHGSDDNGSEEKEQLISGDGKWTWRPAGHFSSRGGERRAFRADLWRKVGLALGEDWESGSVSGTFWYPPGAVREWHTNRFDVRHTSMLSRRPHMPWRMYIVRLKQRLDGDHSENNAHTADAANFREDALDGPSAMHVLADDVAAAAGAGEEAADEGNLAGRISSKMMARIAGAQRLKGAEHAAGNEGIPQSVWRLPDKDGYATLFRLPSIWHCVVSEDVHRYSLGFRLSEREAQRILRLAGRHPDQLPHLAAVTPRDRATEL